MKVKKSYVREFLDMLLTFIIVCAVYIMFRYAIRFPVVSGSSMEPTYHDGDTLAVLYTTRVNQNDVVICWSDNLQEYIVKRVIGVAGDKIEVKNGSLYRNGTRMYESYIADEHTLMTGDVSVTVGVDEYFLLGDNREHSTDSRDLGSVSRNDIFGKVLGRLKQAKEEGQDAELVQ